jgi:hypothetical protein
MRFEERELKPYDEPVPPEQFQIGTVYLSVIFLDQDRIVPTMQPKVSYRELTGNTIKMLSETFPKSFDIEIIGSLT